MHKVILCVGVLLLKFVNIVAQYQSCSKMSDCDYEGCSNKDMSMAAGTEWGCECIGYTFGGVGNLVGGYTTYCNNWGWCGTSRCIPAWTCEKMKWITTPYSGWVATPCPRKKFPSPLTCPTWQYMIDDEGGYYGICTNCTKCYPGTYTTGTCGYNAFVSSVSSNYVCKTCPAGSFTSAIGQTSCTACPPGNIAPAGSTACTQCTGNTYPSDGFSWCATCPTNTTGSGGVCTPISGYGWDTKSLLRSCGAAKTDSCTSIQSNGYSDDSGTCKESKKTIDGNYTIQAKDVQSPLQLWPTWFAYDLGSVQTIRAGMYYVSTVNNNYYDWSLYVTNDSYVQYLLNCPYSGVSAEFPYNYRPNFLEPETAFFASSTTLSYYAPTDGKGVWRAFFTVSKVLRGRYIYLAKTSPLYLTELELYGMNAIICPACSPGSTSDINCNCISCTAGYFCTGTSVGTCPAGTYSNSGQSTCTNCAAGKYNNGTAQNSSGCLTCPTGTFVNSTGAVACTPCTVTACQSETYLTAVCVSSADRVCTPCTPPCAAGFSETAVCNATANRVCTELPVNVTLTLLATVLDINWPDPQNYVAVFADALSISAEFITASWYTPSTSRRRLLQNILTVLLSVRVPTTNASLVFKTVLNSSSVLNSTVISKLVADYCKTDDFQARVAQSCANLGVDVVAVDKNSVTYDVITATNPRCPAGPYYCLGSLVYNCTATCRLGTFLDQLCNSNQDTKCTACPPDNYCPGDNTKVLCQALHPQPCPVVTYQSSPCNGTALRVCSPCPANSVCPGDNYAYPCATAGCLTCPVGQYLGAISGSPACVPCSTASCGPDMYVSSPCSVTGRTADRGCSACPNGFYCDGIKRYNASSFFLAYNSDYRQLARIPSENIYLPGQQFRPIKVYTFSNVWGTTFLNPDFQISPYGDYVMSREWYNFKYTRLGIFYLNNDNDCGTWCNTFMDCSAAFSIFKGPTCSSMFQPIYVSPTETAIDAFALSPDGTYVLFAEGYCIKKMTIPGYEVTIIAGDQYTANTVNGPGSVARFARTYYMQIDPYQTFVVVCPDSARIRKINLTDGNYTVSTLVGEAGLMPANPTDGSLSQASVYAAAWPKFNYDGSKLYFFDYGGRKLRKIVFKWNNVSSIPRFGAWNKNPNLFEQWDSSVIYEAKAVDVYSTSDKIVFTQATYSYYLTIYTDTSGTFQQILFAVDESSNFGIFQLHGGYSYSPGTTQFWKCGFPGWGVNFDVNPHLCVKCTSNTFSAGGVCAPCKPNCTSGFYESTPCLVRDRVCSPCAAACGPGTYQTSACTVSSNRVCTPCPGASYCPNGSVALPCATSCPVNNYRLSVCNSTADQVCRQCSVCGTGTYETTPCTQLTNRVCSTCRTTPCGAGFYMLTACTNKTDLVCLPCNNCPINTYETQACTATAPKTCVACPAGTVCDGSAQRYNGSTFYVTVRLDGTENMLHIIDKFDYRTNALQRSYVLNDRANYFSVSISPRGDYLFYCSNTKIKRLDFATGAITLVYTGLFFQGRYSELTVVVIAPDGTYALFAEGNAVHKLTIPGYVMSQVAGVPYMPNQYPFENANGTAARFWLIRGLDIHPDGTWAVVSDRGNSLLRKIDLTQPTYPVTTLYGSHIGTRIDVDGPFSVARMMQNTNLAFNADGTRIYYWDEASFKLKRVDLLSKTVTTILSGSGPSRTVTTQIVSRSSLITMVPNVRLNSTGVLCNLTNISDPNLQVLVDLCQTWKILYDQVYNPPPVSTAVAVSCNPEVFSLLLCKQYTDFLFYRPPNSTNTSQPEIRQITYYARPLPLPMSELEKQDKFSQLKTVETIIDAQFRKLMNIENGITTYSYLQTLVDINMTYTTVISGQYHNLETVEVFYSNNVVHFVNTVPSPVVYYYFTDFEGQSINTRSTGGDLTKSLKIWRCRLPGYGLDTSTDVCGLCPAGKFSMGGVCQTCAPACVLAGVTYQVSDCNATTNRRCALCTPACLQGFNESKGCTPTQDRVCTPCVVCAPGFYNSSCFSCAPCPANSFCSNGVGVKPCSNCSTGYFRVSSCNSTTDAVCTKCADCSACRTDQAVCNR